MKGLEFEVWRREDDDSFTELENSTVAYESHRLQFNMTEPLDQETMFTVKVFYGSQYSERSDMMILFYDVNAETLMTFARRVSMGVCFLLLFTCLCLMCNYYCISAIRRKLTKTSEEGNGVDNQEKAKKVMQHIYNRRTRHFRSKVVGYDDNRGTSLQRLAHFILFFLIRHLPLIFMFLL